MLTAVARRRPGLLTLLGVVSVALSALGMIRLIAGAVLFLFAGVASWLGGPQAGLIGGLIAGVMLVWLFAGSILSIVLFRAGVMTLRDDPAGVRLHRLWAWLSLGLAMLGVLASGRSSYSWTILIYAVGVLYVTGRPVVRAYCGEEKPGKLVGAGRPGRWDGESA